MANYAVAAGPRRLGRRGRIVFIVGETIDYSVFRWAGDDHTVIRIAAEVGVSPQEIQWANALHDGPEMVRVSD